MIKIPNSNLPTKKGNSKEFVKGRRKTHPIPTYFCNAMQLMPLKKFMQE
jgi:hypothetical protein